MSESLVRCQRRDNISRQVILRPLSARRDSRAPVIHEFVREELPEAREVAARADISSIVKAVYAVICHIMLTVILVDHRPDKR